MKSDDSLRFRIKKKLKEKKTETKKIIAIFICVFISNSLFSKKKFHIIDIWCFLKKNINLKHLSMSLKITERKNHHYIHITPLGLLKINKEILQIGLKKNTTHKMLLKNSQKTTSMIYFSKISNNKITSIDHKYKWGSGIYTLTLFIKSFEKIKKKTFTWIGLDIFNHTTKQKKYLGALRVNGKSLTLNKQFIAFVEIDNNSLNSRYIIHIKKLKINHKKIKKIKYLVYYPKKSPRISLVKKNKHSLKIEVGVKKRPKNLKQTSKYFYEILK